MSDTEQSVAEAVAALTEELAALREEVRQLRMAQAWNAARVVYIPQYIPQPYYVVPQWQPPVYGYTNAPIPQLSAQHRT